MGEIWLMLAAVHIGSGPPIQTDDYGEIEVS